MTENNTVDSDDFTVPEGKKPYVIMVVGVNGVGKTTTIGKLAYQFKKAGKSVYLGAADTFRAAAVEQLDIWGERVGVPVIKQKMGSDPASVAFDTLSSAVANNADVVIIDTAGRLHNKVGLMNELTKIKNVMKKVVPDAPNEVLTCVGWLNRTECIRTSQAVHSGNGGYGNGCYKVGRNSQGWRSHRHFRPV